MDTQRPALHLPERMMIGILKRVAAIRRAIEVEHASRQPRTTRLMRLKSVLLRLQQRLARIARAASAMQLEPVPVTSRRSPR